MIPRKPSWPWQPRHNPLPPPVRVVLSFLGWCLAVVLAFLIGTYLIDFFV